MSIEIVSRFDDSVLGILRPGDMIDVLRVDDNKEHPSMADITGVNGTEFCLPKAVFRILLNDEDEKVQFDKDNVVDPYDNNN